jgi:putative flippase GtrA
MSNILSFEMPIRRWVYALAAPILVFSQHLMVEIIYKRAGEDLIHDAYFWLLPLRRLAQLPSLTATMAALSFTYGFVIVCALALLSYRRAFAIRQGYLFAALSVVPVVQLIGIAALTILPAEQEIPVPKPMAGADVADIIKGVLAGTAIIVAAVLISAVTFGAYGWGLFILTPFMVGVTTAYIANRRLTLDHKQNTSVVLLAALLGSVALIMFALEGLVCIILIAPLAALAAIAGGLLGRKAAMAGRGRDTTLMSVAFLPAIFALEGAMPPAIPIQTMEVIDIQAPPSKVWQTLINDDKIDIKPSLVGSFGLAYPIKGRFKGEGVGAERIGEFSTGFARERVTEWVPQHSLAFAVVSQPPAMEEMSPYRKVHSPHVQGYFTTGETHFELALLPNGATRLSITASHELRIDPALYWEPIARWAIHNNTWRVLDSIRNRSEAVIESGTK